jgi:hypothetical protein
MSQLFLTLHGIAGFVEAAAIIIKADCIVSEDFTTAFVAGQGFFYFFLGMQQVAEIIPGLAMFREEMNCFAEAGFCLREIAQTFVLISFAEKLFSGKRVSGPGRSFYASFKFS